MTSARELLAAAADRLGYTTDARMLRSGKPVAFIQVNAALAAIEAARDSGSDAQRGDAFAAPSEGSQSGTRDSAGIAQPEGSNHDYHDSR